ncbi:hypothetical protein HB364_10135 [Pseudoflavitalea sp. X16]|nr:hypothetical protein [Paraflavitalea devenefica]
MIGINLPLNNVQMELMKLFSTGLSDKDLTELKKVLAKFYSDKAVAQANEIWDQKGLTDEDMDKWLNQKS